MTTDRPPQVPEGQLDVYECIEIAERDEAMTETESTGNTGPNVETAPRPLTPAEAVAHKLKETE